MTQRRKRRRPPPRLRRQAAAKNTHGSLDWVRDQAWRQVGDGWVREVFPDRLIVERDNGALQERSWSIADGGDLQLGDPVDVSLEYVAKAEGGPRLTGPIVAKDEARRLVYGAVLVPGEPDSDGEILTAEKIEDVAHTWLEAFRAIDVQHDVERIDASPVESYIEPADREVEIGDETVTLPAGTWTMAARIHDDEAWKTVVAGDAAGFSIMGVPEDEFDAALEAVKSAGQGSAALKRTTLADIGGGDPNGPWVAPFVSLVSAPAVPKAKFYAIKAAGAPEPRLSAADIRAAVDAWAAAGKQRTERNRGMSPDEIKNAVKSALDTALDEKLKPLDERLKALEDTGDGETEGGEAGAGKADDGETETGAGELSEATLAAITTAVNEAVKPIAEKATRAEQRTRPGSRQPAADDDFEPVMKGAPGRDAFGRRING